MTTFELTWQQDNDRSHPDFSSTLVKSRYMQWFIKSFLKGEIGGATTGLWTCEGSSDSVTANNAGTDLWGSSFTASKIVRASSGVHSWIVLKSPVGLGPFYMCIDFLTASDQLTSFHFSKSPFTLSAGTTSLRPTANNEFSFTSQQIVEATATQEHWSTILSTTGQWWLRGSRDGLGWFQFMLAFFALTGTKTGEAHNGWAACEFLSGSPGVLDADSGWFSAANTRTIKGRSKDGAAAVNGLFPRPYCNTNASGAFPIFSDNGAGGGVGGVTMPTTDATDGLYNDFPIYLLADTNGFRSLRGRVQDVTWAPEGAANALVEPTSGPPYQSSVFGDMWFPYSASAPPTI